jgi:hypothetical protein
MNVAERERVLACAAQCLGAEAFNRLAASAPETRAKGRLRFWQEELLARLSAETGTTVKTLDTFLAVFEGAPLCPLPEPPPRVLTKEEFLSDPVAVYLDPQVHSIPAEWFREAWDALEEDPERSLREYVTGDIWHEANKGCLPLVAGQLRGLAGVLRADQWARMYDDIRRQEPHRESEIRREFIDAAPHWAAALPPPLTRDEVVQLLGSEEEARELGAFDEESTGQEGPT